MTWIIAAHRCELVEPGDFVTITPDVAVMNVDGEVVAFMNTCPHRGARIYTEPRGNRPPVCAYHGRCARPSQVETYLCQWVGDWLLVDWTDGRVRLGDGNGLSHMEADFLRGSPALRLHSEIRRTYDFGWRVAVENALDNEHVAHVHTGTLATLQLARAGLEVLPGGSSIEAFRSAVADRLDRVAPLFASTYPFDYAHLHLAPYSAVATTRGWTYALQLYLPRLDGRTDFVSRLFVQTEAGARPGQDRYYAAVAAMNDRVFAEDEAICQIVVPGFTGNLGPRDDRIAHFRESLL
jgi:hypothetical protein